ncbi:junctional cadherin 5-associated protein [Sorex araneus]|uniref:junctional cadherin 5-associated protein n=1 Tax=Sorex araneus TaxID=42254 RepID=UPI002433AEFF|nr:junctional cadherin 5-associated protein [Sorex araneus]XP_055002810.1 junctional cadherin 5-associated protein [Sorex araneus]
MYSVQDLLVSHGYKLSRNTAAHSEESPEGRQRARARGRTSQGLLNGCEDGRTVPPQSKAAGGRGRTNDAESSRRLQRAHGELQSGAVSRPSDVGFCNPPVLVWTSQPQPGQQQTYWRRRGQEACGLLAPGPLEELEARRMAQAHSLPAHVRESPWEVSGRTEHVMKKATWEEELRAAPWREGSPDGWGQPRRLGRHMSDGDGERLFRDLYPYVPGEQVLNPQSRGKSRSLPRVLSPEGLSCTEIPIALNDGHVPGAPHRYPPNCALPLEAPRHPEKGAFPRPKFGRPLRPPPYNSYQQSRGPAESGGSPDGQHADPYGHYAAKSGAPRPELCLSDPALEPPVYVPPPSYRSPPQPIANPYLEEPAPRPGPSARSPQPHPGEKAGAGGPFPASSLAAGHEYGASPRSPRSPRGLPPQPRPTATAAAAATTAPDGSVLYIPFDDPRIRHIRVAQNQGFYEEAKPDEKVPRYSPFPVSQSAPGPTLLYSALVNPQSGAPLPGHEGGAVFDHPMPPWLWDQLLRDGESSGFPDPRDPFGVVQGQRPDPRSGRQGSREAPAPASPAPLGESTCETQTRLRKFETGIPTKRSAKKKTNETIFCLVSIPIKSEAPLPATDINHKDLKRGTAQKNGLDKSLALREQSPLSMSSTDLELQALTGSMVTRAGLPKQEPARPDMDKQANDLSPLPPVRQGGLKSSGSWPGHQYRDQQTQTSFTEEPKTPAPHPAAEVGRGPNTVLTAKFIDPAVVPETQVHPALSPGDCRRRPNACHLKGQMSLNLSSNSAFSRTLSSTGQAPAPKESLRQPGAEGLGHPDSPKLQGEGAKGPPPGPSHNKELFGQFLLKPVSRRPWDLISQLESFNKELQEEEGSSHSSSSGSSSSGDSSSCSSSEDSDTEWPREGRVHSTPKHSGFRGHRQQETGVEGGSPWMLGSEDPGFRAGGRVKSKSESWSDEPRPAPPSDRPPFPGPCGGDSRPSALRSLAVEKEKEPETRDDVLSFSPGPVKRIPSPSQFSDSKPAADSCPAHLREPQERQSLPNVVSTQGPSTAVPPSAESGAQQDPALPLSLASKARGLSAPDLRSVGLPRPAAPSANGLDGSLGTVGVTEIPPNESLQERAARILGIEVAVESLLPGARRSAPNQYPEHSERACRPEPLPEVTVTRDTPSGESTVSADAFYGRRKCGWTQSPLFVGERESARRSPEAAQQHPGVDPGPAPSAQRPESPNHKDAPSNPPFRSTLLHVVERSPSAGGSGSSGGERKLRGTSKVIESLQEKLASPARRAAPERLMRMKEVSSVSRMRLLTSLGADSTDSTEDPDELSEPEPRAPAPAGPPGSSLSLEENGHPAAPQDQNAAHNFWCPDSYDPSRVERV